MNKQYITTYFARTADDVFNLNRKELEQRLSDYALPSADNYRAEITARLALINHMVQEHVFEVSELDYESDYESDYGVHEPDYVYNQPYTESWENKLGFTLVFEVDPDSSWTASIRGEVIESGTDHDSLASYKELTLNPNYTNV